ncbi:MAG: protein kinase [Chlamydiota bacterium]|nr:protein kinase [Chlamydiota bacterium]
MLKVPVQLGKRTFGPKGIEPFRKKQKKSDLSDQQIRVFAKKYLVSSERLQQKQSDGSLSSYLEKKARKYNKHTLKQAQKDYAIILKTYNSNDEDIILKKNDISLSKDLMMKLIRKSNLLLCQHKIGDNDVTFNVKWNSKNLYFIAKRANEVLSIINWSGSTQITKNNPKFLGRGGCGTIQKIVNIATGTVGALKTANEPKYNTNILEEVDILKAIHNPTINQSVQLPATHTLQLKGRKGAKLAGFTQPYYNSGDLVDCRTLKVYFRTYNTNEKLKVLQQLFLGLKSIHDKGVIHGDIKPDNCFVNINESKKINLYIADLGGAKQSNGKLDIEFNSCLGTMVTLGYFTKSDYLALAECSQSDDTESWLTINRSRDLFATAMTIWISLTENRPYDDDNSNLCFPDTTKGTFDDDLVEQLIGPIATDALICALSEAHSDRPTIDEMIEAFSS